MKKKQKNIEYNRIFVRRFLHTLGELLVKFYLEIVAGIWAVILTMPLDNYLYTTFTGVPSYPHLGGKFWLFFTIYTGFFVCSALCVPIIRKKNMQLTLRKLAHQHKITDIQKKKLEHILKNANSYQPLWTKNGFCTFLLDNFFSISVIFAYFGIEGLIANFLNNETKVVSIIFIGLFFVFMWFESLLDAYITSTLKHTNQVKKTTKQYSVHKKLLSQIIEDIGGGSPSDDFGDFIINETYDDIVEITKLLDENYNKYHHTGGLHNLKLKHAIKHLRGIEKPSINNSTEKNTKIEAQKPTISNKITSPTINNKEQQHSVITQSMKYNQNNIKTINQQQNQASNKPTTGVIQIKLS